MKNTLFMSKKMIEVFWFGVSAIGKLRILEIWDELNGKNISRKKITNVISVVYTP